MADIGRAQASGRTNLSPIWQALQLDGNRRGFVSRVPASGPIEALTLARDVVVAPDVFFDRYGALYGLGSDDEMIPYASGESSPGFLFTRYLQHHRGVPVFGATVVLAHDEARVRFALGAVATALPDETASDIEPRLAAQAAVAAVASRHARRVEQLRVSPAPIPELGFAGVGRDRRLCYRVVVSADVPIGRHRVDVDAKTGEPVWVLPSSRFLMVTKAASGPSLYNGYVTFLADEDSQDGSWRLTEVDGYPVQTRDANGTSDPASSTSITDLDGIFNSTTDDCLQGVSAHWAAERALEYFKKMFQRNGVDGQGKIITNLVRFDTLVAQFDVGADGTPYLMFRGNVSEPPISLDTVGHEFTHGIAQYTADFDYYYYESGALDESFADIFGTAVEFATTPQTANWLVGEDWASQIANATVGIRSLQDPKFGCGDNLAYTHCQPTTYLHDPWVTPIGSPAPTDDVVEWSQAHTNSGVGNYCFYLLSEGGQGTNDNGDAYDVQGIGIDDAARISYLNLTSKLSSQSGYVQAAAGAIEVSTQLFGEFSQGRISTQDAWAAVGVSAPYSETPYLAPVGLTDPWPVRFEWEQGIAEDSWVVQVSETPDFSTDVQEFPASTIETVAGKDVGTLEVPLKPGTDYWWRVRNANAIVSTTSANAPWRPNEPFTTGPKKVTLLSPRTFGRSGTKYPWGLEFSWKGVDGADHYEVELAKGPINDWSQLIFPAVEVFDTSKALDVSVKAQLHWHARAIPTEGAAYAGEWSDPFAFTTLKPKVKIDKPGDGDPVYPWPVTLSWHEVKGAAKYKVELYRAKDQWGQQSQAKPLDFTPPTTHVDLNLRPRLFSDTETHKWRVRVWGPPPLSEEGQDSGWYTFVNNGDDTIPQLLDGATLPGAPGPLGFHWMQDGKVALTWKEVLKAERYHLRLMDFGDLTMDPKETALETDLEPGVDYQSDSVMQTSVSAGKLNPPPGVGVTGYWWNMLAIGPEELPGLSEPGNGLFFFVWPDPPVFVYPPPFSDVFPYDNNQAAFEFTNPYSPSGKYVVFFLDLSTFNSVFEVVPGNPGGTTGIGLWELPSLDLKPSRTYAFAARAHSDCNLVVNNQPLPVVNYQASLDPMYPWSSEWFNTKAKPPPPPPPPPPQAQVPPTLVCPVGGDQLPGENAYICWSEVSNASAYELTVGSVWDATYTQSDDGNGVYFQGGYVVAEVLNFHPAGAEFEWTVRAKVNSVWTDWAAPASFLAGPYSGIWNDDCGNVGST